MTKCECGCGQETNIGCRFILCHNRIGKYHSEETKQLLSKIHIGKYHSEETKQLLSKIRIGKQHSEETRMKISEANKGEKNGMWGKHYSEETRKKISEAYKGEKSYMWGKHHSEETRKKISKKLTRRKLSDEHKMKLKLAHYLQESKERYRLARLRQVIPTKNSKIEKILQANLLNSGVQFRTHEPIVGQPDIFIEPNICVFADGCFYHYCKPCMKREPTKYDINRMRRDAYVTRKLTEQGYIVLRYWEHDIYNKLDYCIAQIKNAANINEAIVCQN